MSEVTNKKLSPAIESKFSLKPGTPIGKHAFKGRQFDLTTIDLDEAEDLVKAGCDILIPKKEATEKTK